MEKLRLEEKRARPGVTVPLSAPLSYEVPLGPSAVIPHVVLISCRDVRAKGKGGKGPRKREKWVSVTRD